MNHEQIVQEIISGQFTNDQIDAIANAVSFARKQLTRKATFAIRIGNNVKFTHKDRTFTGTVQKVKLAKITVNVDQWTNGKQALVDVPANMLTVVEG